MQTPLPIAFWLPGAVVPKQRPRFCSETKTTYTAKGYRAWKSQAIRSLRCDLMDEFGAVTETISIPVAIDIVLVGFCRGDADNIGGSIMDALVQAKILHDDSLKWVPKITVEYRESKKNKGALFTLSPHVIQSFEVKY